MSGFGYSRVERTAMLAFNEDLNQGEWGRIAPLEVPPGNGAVAFSAGLLVAIKARLVIAIRLLSAVMAGQIKTLAELDLAWDRAQRRLAAAISILLYDDDDAAREDARVLKVAFLIGDQGSGQTSYSYNDEVDFGRKQLALIEEPNHAAQIANRDLVQHFKDIRVATEALAAGLGRHPERAETASTASLLNAAQLQCVAACNGAHDQLLWLKALDLSDADRQRVDRLLEPLVALLLRHEDPPTPALTPDLA